MIDVKSFGQLVRFIWPHTNGLRKILASISVWQLVLATYPLLTAFMMKLCVNKYLVKHQWHMILSVIIGLLVFVLLVFVVNSFVAGFTKRIASTVHKRMVFQYLNHLSKQGAGFYRSKSAEKIASCISQDVPKLSSTLINTIFKLIEALIFTVGAVVLIFCVGAPLALATIILFTMVLMLPKRFVRKAKGYARQSRRVLDHCSSLVLATARSFNIVRFFQATDFFHQKIENSVNTQIYNDTESKYFSRIHQDMSEAAFEIFLLLMLLLGVYFVLHSYMKLGDLFVFIVLSYRLQDSVKVLTRQQSIIYQMLAACDNYNTLINANFLEDGKDIVLNEQEFSLHQANLLFKQVSFSYPNSNFKLKNISFELFPGQSIAIVGPSGSGKSTLLSLIMKENIANEGCIKLGDEDVTKMPFAKLATQAAVVFQVPQLFDLSIKDNICLGYTPKTQEEMYAAAKAAGIHEVILSLPFGYDTEYGQEGVFLSQGQIQRITIARALLRKPKLLLLDEPTSSLDSKTENNFMSLLERLRGQQTTILVTHNMLFASKMDVIIVMDEGRMVQMGTHDELLQQEGTYALLWQGAQLFTKEKFGLR